MENALTIRDNPTEIPNIIQNSNNMHCQGDCSVDTR